MKSLTYYVYEYYQIYTYLFAYLCTAFLIMYRSHYSFTTNTQKNTFMLCGTFFLAAFCAILCKHHLPTLTIVSNTTFAQNIAFTIKIGLNIVLGSMNLYFLEKVFLLAKRGFSSRFLSENKYGFVIFFLTATDFILYRANTIASWISVWYVVDYSIGLGSRFFIGSLLHLLFGTYITAAQAILFCNTALLLIIAITSYLLNHLLKRCPLKRVQNALIFLILCLLLMPGYINEFWHASNIGRLETYTFLIMLLAIMCLCGIKHILLKHTLAILLIIISMAIYQGNLFMYYPMVFMVLLDTVQRAPDVKSRNREITGTIANLIATACSFGFFQFCTSINYTSTDELYAVLSTQTDMEILTDALQFEFFESIFTTFQIINVPFLTNTEFPREKTFLTLVLLLPVIVIITALYLKCIEHQVHTKHSFFKSPYIPFLVIPLAILPQFILNVDWCRWLTATVLVVFFGIFYLAYKQDKGMYLALEKLNNFLQKHQTLAIVTLLYLALITQWGARDFMPEVDTIFEALQSTPLL